MRNEKNNPKVKNGTEKHLVLLQCELVASSGLKNEESLQT